MVVCPFESELEACVASDKRNDEYSKTLMSRFAGSFTYKTILKKL